MSRFIKLMLCIFVFCLDIRVKANSSEKQHINNTREQTETISGKGFLTEPKECLGHYMPCALLLNFAKNKKIMMAGTGVYLSQKSFVIQKQASLLRLIDGYIVVEAQKEFVVETEFGKVKLSNSSALIRITNERVEVVGLKSTNKLLMLSEEELTLPEGYENWMSGMTKRGRQFVGFPRAANVNRLVSDWGRVFLGRKEELEGKLLKFRKMWRVAVEETGQRSLASIKTLQEEDKKNKQRQLQYLKRVQRENAKLRQLFYRKTFEN